MGGTGGKRTSRRSRRRGAVVVLAAVLMTVMAGMVAFAVDCGMIALAREQLQNAADSAAMAGADALSGGSAAATAAAQSFAQANVAGGTLVVVNPTQDIQLGTWDKNTLTFNTLTGAAQQAANAVRVTCQMSQARGNPLKLFFAPIFGQKAADVSAQAVATNPGTVCGPFIGLNSVSLSGGTYTDSYDSSQGPYSESAIGSKGNVCSNASVSLSGGATVKGDAHAGPGNTVNISGGASVTGSTTALTQPLNEPSVNFGNSTAVNNNSNIPLTAKGNTALDTQGNFMLSGGDSVALPPGTYCFATFSLSGGSSLDIAGKTIVYCTGNVDLSGGTVTNSTQLPINLQLYCTGPQVRMSGGSDFYGVVYAPTAAITRSGGSDLYGMVVGASLDLSGGSGLHYDQSLASLVGAQPRAQLVQ